MRRLSGLIKKEFLHFYRDPVAMLLILYHFTVCVLLCGYCFSYDVDLNTVVYDMNQSATSREIIRSFLSTEYFNLDTYAVSLKEVAERIESGKARVGLIIPPDFTRNLMDNRPADIQFVTDGSESNLAGHGMGFAKRIIAVKNQEIIKDRLTSKGLVITDIPGIDNQLRIFYNQEMNDTYFVVIFHIVIAGIVGGLILSSTAVVREKERGTIDQLLVTPIKPMELLLAKIIAPITIGLIATLFSFSAIFWFDVPCRGNPITVFITMGVFLLSMTGIGILVGTICKNNLQAILMSFGLMFPCVSLSGLTSPFDNMPPFLQYLGLAFPPTHYITVINGIFQKGNGFEVLWPNILILLGMGLVFLSLGGFVTSRQWRQ